MTDSLFDNPHQNEAADDAFVSPNQDFEGTNMGASPVNPVEAARAPKKRMAVFLIGAAVLMAAIFLIVASRGTGTDSTELTPDEQRQQAEAARGSKDPVTVAPPAQYQPPVDPLADSSTMPPAMSGQDPFIDPAKLQPTVDPSMPGAVVQNVPGVPAIPAGLPGQSTLPGAPLPPGMAPPALPVQASDTTLNPAIPSQAELDRQAALDRQRQLEEEQAARRTALLEAIKQEEARLRQGATQAVENQALSSAGSRNAGTSRFAAPEAANGGADADAGGAAVASAPVAATGASAPAPRTSAAYDIKPGTRIQAVTISEFSSDQSGAGLVEMRLTTPLRSRAGRMILPAGTRAFGTVQVAGSPQPGKGARVGVMANVFVLPNGVVLRDLSGQAADPRTLALSIPAKANHHFMQRVARGALSSVVDYKLAEKADPPACVTALEGDGARTVCMETPKTQAINDIRGRARSMINGPIGNESSVEVSVTLPQSTPLVLIFGLN